jgi:hypothetical protein
MSSARKKKRFFGGVDGLDKRLRDESATVAPSSITEVMYRMSSQQQRDSDPSLMPASLVIQQRSLELCASLQPFERMSSVHSASSCQRISDTDSDTCVHLEFADCALVPLSRPSVADASRCPPLLLSALDLLCAQTCWMCESLDSSAAIVALSALRTARALVLLHHRATALPAATWVELPRAVRPLLEAATARNRVAAGPAVAPEWTAACTAALVFGCPALQRSRASWSTAAAVDTWPLLSEFGQAVGVRCPQPAAGVAPVLQALRLAVQSLDRYVGPVGVGPAAGLTAAQRSRPACVWCAAARRVSRAVGRRGAELVATPGSGYRAGRAAGRRRGATQPAGCSAAPGAVHGGDGCRADPSDVRGGRVAVWCA